MKKEWNLNTNQINYPQLDFNNIGYEDVIFFWDRHHNKISYTEKLEFKARVRDIVSIDMLRMLLIACEDKVILYHTPQRQEILQIVHDVEIRKIVVNHLRLNSSEMIMYTVTADDVLYAWQINFNFDTGDHSAYQIFKIDSVQFISDCRWMSDLWIVHKRCYVVLIDGDSGAEKRIFRTWASEAILGIHVSKTYTSRGAAALAAANYGNGNNVLLPASSSSNSSTANNSIASLSSLNGGGGAVGDNTGQFLGTTGTAGRASTRKSTTARTVGSGVSSGAGRHGDSAHSPSSSSSPSPGMLTSGGSEHVAFVTENTLYVDFTIWSFGGTIKDKYQLLDCKFAAPRHT